MLKEWPCVLLKGFTLPLLHKVVVHNKIVHNKLKNCGMVSPQRPLGFLLHTGWELGPPQTTSKGPAASEEFPSISATKETRELRKKHYICIFVPPLCGAQDVLLVETPDGMKKTICIILSPSLPDINQCWSSENLHFHYPSSWNHNISVWNACPTFFSGLKFMCKLNVIVCLIYLLDCHSNNQRINLNYS